MTTFSIKNYGCRATEADASALRRELLAHGLTAAAEQDTADVIVLNTCTVTAAADSEARHAVRKIHSAHPASRILVTGCYAQRAPEEIAALEGVSWVVGNSHQSEIPALIRGLAQAAPDGRVTFPETSGGASPDFIPLAALDDDPMSLSRGPAKILTGDIFAHTTIPIARAAPLPGDRTRPILKIQDGCNNRCSYCVIPLVRGRSRSLPPDRVIEEIRRLVAVGTKEIVLSGINLGSYGRDLSLRATLAGVVQRILRETEIERLRFSSIEPQDVTEEFVSLIASSNRLARHFHIPLQSGSDRILRAMHRWYRAPHYAERIKLIRRLLPDAAIGADVIAGFPGESDDDFRSTLELIENLPFTYLHVFSFSPRPGTSAHDHAGAVPDSVIRDRARSLRALGQRKSAAFRASQAGRTVRALTLRRQGDGWTEAITGNYLKVRMAGFHPANEWRDARIPADPAECVYPVNTAESVPARG